MAITPYIFEGITRLKDIKEGMCVHSGREMDFITPLPPFFIISKRE
jgi:hypothetical protein